MLKFLVLLLSTFVRVSFGSRSSFIPKKAFFANETALKVQQDWNERRGSFEFEPKKRVQKRAQNKKGLSFLQSR